MKRQHASLFGPAWNTLAVPDGIAPPRDVFVRVQRIPARHYFPRHGHRWNQVVYAIAGVLTVALERHALVVAPGQAVWLPTGTSHSVGARRGAEFRSLYVADRPSVGMPSTTTVFQVSDLLRALVIEAAAVGAQAPVEAAYRERIAAVILDQLRRAVPAHTALPWPRDGPLLTICESLYATPADARDLNAWGRLLGMSGRTLARRFDGELGIGWRAWRRRLRVFRAVELLATGVSVTEIALELGYASTSAFIFMFRHETGLTPSQHRRATTSIR